jgi:small multidrug resistance pump
MKGWMFLAAAIGCEVGGFTCMRLSQSFTRLGPSLLLFPLYAATLVNMTMAMKYLEVGLVYAVWSGVGTSVVTLIGIFLFHESASPMKFTCIGVIIVGVMGLNWVSPPNVAEEISEEVRERVSESHLLP